MGLTDKVAYWSNRLARSLQAAQRARRSYPQGTPQRENAYKERDRAAIKLVGYSIELSMCSKGQQIHIDGLLNKVKDLTESKDLLAKRVAQLQGDIPEEEAKE